MNTRFCQLRACLAMAIAVIGLVAITPAEAGNIFVDDDADPAVADGSREHPYATIQEGIASASAGDAVRVGPGTYYGRIELKSRVSVYGGARDPVLGWPSTIINGYDRRAHNTLIVAEDVINARLDGVAIVNGRARQAAGMYIRNSSVTVHRCSFDYNECYSTLSDTGNGGAMMIRGRARTATVSECDFAMNSTPDGNGGAIAIHDADPQITDCVFRGNTAPEGSGGAVYNENASPTITGCRFLPYTTVSGDEITYHANQALNGGGIGNVESSPMVRDCQFEGNRAVAEGDIGGRGGGICNFRVSTPTIEDCRFEGNVARYGGGIWNGSASPEVSNCVFEANVAAVSGRGGGICHDHELFEAPDDARPSAPRIVNCTFWKNTAGTGGGVASRGAGASSDVINCTFYGNRANGWDFGPAGSGGLSCLAGTEISVRNSIFWNNSGEPGREQIEVEASAPTITYCSVQGGFSGPTNDAREPRFRNPDNGDFHLRETSECIDAGDPVTVGLPPTDFEGDTRVIGERVDIGVDEWHLMYAEMTWEFRWGNGHLRFIIKWPYEFPHSGGDE